MKPADDATILAAAAVLAPLARAAGALFIVNDNPRLARASGADGVHVGEDDSSIAEARATLGAEALIGATCGGDLARAAQAAQAGADYVAFGAFAPSQTKTDTRHTAGPGVLRAWRAQSPLPAVAIGGMTPDLAREAFAAGAWLVAVGGFVWRDVEGAGALALAAQAA